MELSKLYNRFQNIFLCRRFQLETAGIRIERFEDASFFIDDLFRKSFGQPPPGSPMDYVAFCRLDPSTFKTVGYIHMIEFEDYGLVGGLCVDPEFRHKGLGSRLLNHVQIDIGGKKALFVHTENPTIARQCGYKSTNRQYLMVKWIQSVSGREQETLIDEVAKIGPF